jgi:signal transduction histidine kinase
VKNALLDPLKEERRGTKMANGTQRHQIVTLAEELYSAGHRPFDLHVERLIALLRVALTVFSAAGIYEASILLNQNKSATILLFAAYGVFALGVVAISLISQARTGWQLPTHLVDIGMVSLLMHFLETSSPFFLLYTFLLLGATTRWNWRGAVWTTTSLLGLDLLLTFVTGGFHLGNAAGAVIWSVLKDAFLVVTGGMFAFFGASQEASRNRLLKLAAWPSPAGDQLDDIFVLLDAALNHVANIMQVRRVLLLWILSDEPFLCISTWFNGQSQHDRKPADELVDWTAAELAGLTFASSNVMSRKCISARGTINAKVPLISEALCTAYQLTSVASAPICGSNCAGRIFMLDKPDWGEDDLILAEIVAERIVIELEHSALRQQLAERIASTQRIRLARDLHDGVLQGLTAAALQLKSVVGRVGEEAKEGINNVLDLLTFEQRRIRFFVEGRRLSIAGPTLELGERIRQLAKQNSRLWLCEVHVATTPEQLWVAGDLVDQMEFVLAETVANAVRHGRASRVDVTVKVATDRIQLRICDNGFGLKNAPGVYTHEELAARQIGPTSLCARIRELDGDLTLRSSSEGVEICIELPV